MRHEARGLLLLVFAMLGVAVGMACTSKLAAEARPVMDVAPPEVEYGCQPSPPNNRCIVVLRDSLGPTNMPILITDTVPVGVTRTVAISRALTAGEKVVIRGTFEGLTATNKKAAAINARGEGVFDPAPVAAVPFIRVVIE